MRIAIMGAGGVGGYFGGLLAKSGEDVILIARSDHLKAILENGLSIRSPKGDFSVKVPATDKVADIDPVDLILFCVKGYDTTDAARMLRPIVSEGTIIISLQNGVEKEETIGQILGRDKVMGGLCALSAYIEAPGIINHKGLERLAFGELDGTISDRGKRVLKVFQDAGINSTLSGNITAEEWEKFAFICALGGLCTVTRLPLGPIMESNKTKKMYVNIIKEIVEISRKKLVQLDDNVVEKLITFTNSLSPDVRPSMYRDLINKKRLELDTLNGAAVRLGKNLEIPTPTNDFIYACLDAINKDNLGHESV